MLNRTKHVGCVLVSVWTMLLGATDVKSCWLYADVSNNNRMNLFYWLFCLFINLAVLLCCACGNWIWMFSCLLTLLTAAEQQDKLSCSLLCVCASFPILVVWFSFTDVCLIASFPVIVRPMCNWCSQEVLCGRSHATVFGKPKRSHEVWLDKCYHYHIWTTAVDVHKKFGSFGETKNQTQNTENQTRQFLYLQ